MDGQADAGLEPPNKINGKKTQVWYKPPPPLPAPSIPPPPPKVKDPDLEGINIFIQNPKSLPTDLTPFEQPRDYYQQLVKEPQIPIQPYKNPRIIGSDRTKPIKYKQKALASSKPNPEGIGRHIMRILRGKDIKELQKPLKMTRKEVRLYAEKSQEELAAEDLKGVKGVNNASSKNIAPHGGAAFNKQNMFKKKTIQIFEHDKETRAIKMREALPWVIADVNNVEHLKGKHDENEDSHYIAICFDKNNKATIRKIDQGYNFTIRPPTSKLTLEEKEAEIKAKSKKYKGSNFRSKYSETLKRMVERSKKEDEVDLDTTNIIGGFSKLKTVEGDKKMNDDGEVQEVKDEPEDLDFEEDFQDDDEAQIEPPDEETKIHEERVKKSQKHLNPSGTFDEEDDDLFEEEEEEEEDNGSESILGDSDVENMDKEIEAEKEIAKSKTTTEIKAGNKKISSPKIKGNVKPLTESKSQSKKRGPKPKAQSSQNAISRQKQEEDKANGAKKDPTNRTKTMANQPLKSSPLTQNTTNRPNTAFTQQSSRPIQNGDRTSVDITRTISLAELKAITPEYLVSIVRNNPGVAIKRVFDHLGLKKTTQKDVFDVAFPIVKRVISKGTNKEAVINEPYRNL